MSERIETIRVRRVGGGALPDRAIDLRPGDWCELADVGTHVVFRVHRVNIFKRLWAVLRG